MILSKIEQDFNNTYDYNSALLTGIFMLYNSSSTNIS